MVQRKVPQMDSTEFHAMFHEAATRGWDEDELRQLARMWADESGSVELKGQGALIMVPVARTITSARRIANATAAWRDQGQHQREAQRHRSPRRQVDASGECRDRARAVRTHACWLPRRQALLWELP
jgi:hypothetical protein